MKKSIRNALVFTLTFLLIVGLGVFGMYAAFFYTSKWKYAVDFKKNEDEFNCVKDYVLQYYEGLSRNT